MKSFLKSSGIVLLLGVLPLSCSQFESKPAQKEQASPFFTSVPSTITVSPPAETMPKSSTNLSLPVTSENSLIILGGLYSIAGVNTEKNQNYGGTVLITAQGEGYVLEWKVGNYVYRGWGILQGKTLSVALGMVPPNMGIAIYNIQPNRVLEGVWSTTLKDFRSGTETLIPQK